MFLIKLLRGSLVLCLDSSTYLFILLTRVYLEFFGKQSSRINFVLGLDSWLNLMYRVMRFSVLNYFKSVYFPLMIISKH